MSQRSFGVNMPDSLAQRVEKPLSYGDSRSERIRQLVELGLEVEETMKENKIYTPDHRAQLNVIREAISEHAED